MYQGSALGHGLFHGEDGCGGLVFHLDQGGGLVSDLLGSGYDTGNTVAHMAHLAVKEAAVMGGGLGVALTGLHIVYIGAVLGGDDGGNTGELLCLGSVDGLDVSAGEGAAEHMQAPGIGRHLVLHEDRLAGDQSSAVDLIHRLADDL